MMFSFLLSACAFFKIRVWQGHWAGFAFGIFHGLQIGYHILIKKWIAGKKIGFSLVGARRANGGQAENDHEYLQHSSNCNLTY
jgi:hypothetical protein